MKKNSFYISFMITILISGCSLSPGMYLQTKNNLEGNDSVYVESIEKIIEIEPIGNLLSKNYENNSYLIGTGDEVIITIWGLPEVFPMTNINDNVNLRRVDSKGNIYFPFIGSIKAAGETESNLRSALIERLSLSFNDPQLDVSIVGFNSQKVYVLGEVTKPLKIAISDQTLSLQDALGTANGLNTNTSNASEVFIIRSGDNADELRIFKADMSSPSEFLSASNFYLKDNDVIYVNAKGTARWNRVISQFFPFSSFLNSVNNLTNSD